MMGQHRPGLANAMMRPRFPSVGPRPRIVRPFAPIKQRSLSTPQYNPPVVELDDSPPPHTDSVVTRLTSMGLSVATVEKVPPTKHGWVLPPGLSVTRAPNEDQGPSSSIPSLAKALIQLGEEDGRTRLVQYQLTESQVRGLHTLGLREES